MREEAVGIVIASEVSDLAVEVIDLLLWPHYALADVDDALAIHRVFTGALLQHKIKGCDRKLPTMSRDVEDAAINLFAAMLTTRPSSDASVIVPRRLATTQWTLKLTIVRDEGRRSTLSYVIGWCTGASALDFARRKLEELEMSGAANGCRVFGSLSVDCSLSSSSI
jgi:hypothetical protein